MSLLWAEGHFTCSSLPNVADHFWLASFLALIQRLFHPLRIPHFRAHALLGHVRAKLEPVSAEALSSQCCFTSVSRVHSLPFLCHRAGSERQVSRE